MGSVVQLTRLKSIDANGQKIYENIFPMSPLTAIYDCDSGVTLDKLIRFQNNLFVNLSNGKSFGKYISGDTIPCQGKTVIEMIEDAVTETGERKPIIQSMLLSIPTVNYVGKIISGVQSCSFVLYNSDLVAPNSLRLINITNGGASETIFTATTSPQIFTMTSNVTGTTDGQKQEYRLDANDLNGNVISSPSYTVTFVSSAINKPVLLNFSLTLNGQSGASAYTYTYNFVINNMSGAKENSLSILEVLGDNSYSAIATGLQLVSGKQVTITGQKGATKKFVLTVIYSTNNEVVYSQNTVSITI